MEGMNGAVTKGMHVNLLQLHELYEAKLVTDNDLCIIRHGFADDSDDYAVGYDEDNGYKPLGDYQIIRDGAAAFNAWQHKNEPWPFTELGESQFPALQTPVQILFAARNWYEAGGA